MSAREPPLQEESCRGTGRATSTCPLNSQRPLGELSGDKPAEKA